jgi:hypothetical protein
MENHKITYKTTDGTLKEQRFDDFNEFADAIQDAAMQFYETGMMPNMNVETEYGNLKRKQTVTGNNQSSEFLGESISDS